LKRRINLWKILTPHKSGSANSGNRVFRTLSLAKLEQSDVPASSARIFQTDPLLRVTHSGSRIHKRAPLSSKLLLC
jgi:hypothetical protein